jgi:hypothetical protein
MRILGVLLVPVVALGFILMCESDFFLSPGNLWESLTILHLEADRATEIHKRLHVIQARHDTEWNLIKSLVAGHISFADAAAQVRALRNEAELALLCESLRRFKGASDEERFCRSILAQAETVLERSGCSESEKNAVLARLQKAMTAVMTATIAEDE